MILSYLIDIIAFEAKRPDDSVFKEIVKNLICPARATLLRRQFQQTKEFPESSVISLKCLPIIEVGSTECCNIDLGCGILRTRDKIPRLVEVKDATINFKYVGSVKQFGGREFNHLKPEELPYIKYRKQSRNDFFYTYVNEYIYVPINIPKIASLEAITIRGAFADLLTLAELKGCDEKPCFDLTDGIIIEDHWEDAITKMILAKVAQINKDSEIKINEED